MALTVPMQSRTNMRPFTFTVDSGALPIRVRAEARTAFSSGFSGCATCSGVRYEAPVDGRCGGVASHEGSSVNPPITVEHPESATAKTQMRIPVAERGRG